MCRIIFVLFFITSVSFAQQVDYKDFIKSDSNIINKNTVFNLYWSSKINKDLKIKHIREYKVIHQPLKSDTNKINTLAFDYEGKIIRWNTVGFRYASNGAYLGYVDTLKGEVMLPNVINNSVFTDFYFYSEKRDAKTNLLNNIRVIQTPISDTVDIVYTYNPDLFLKGKETEIDGNMYQLPDGFPCYLQSIKFFHNTVLKYEHIVSYELFEY